MLFAQEADTPPETDTGIRTNISTGVRAESRAVQKRKEISAGFTIGHLLTPAVSTMKAGELTVGTMFAGGGLSDKVSVGTSPWMLGFYNMQNLIARYQDDPGRQKSWGAQLAYFKTDQSLGKTYDMEAAGAWALYRTQIGRSHRLHLSLNYFHFMNSRVPFSLKRWSFNEKEPQGQWSLTTLQEIVTTLHTRVCLEFGVLGLNYHYPNYHFGASTAYRFDGGYIQFGLSATGYFSNMTKSAYNHVYNEWSANNAKMDFPSVYKNSVAIHPEIQLQLFF